MAMEDLPRNYDAIILGTGMPESILAAALARIGMKVLHLDRNDYYSGGWATLNWMGLDQWIQRNQEAPGERESGLADEREERHGLSLQRRDPNETYTSGNETHNEFHVHPSPGISPFPFHVPHPFPRVNPSGSSSDVRIYRFDQRSVSL